MKIVHFSKTPLAGAPIRLVHALQEHSQHEVHLVDLERWGNYQHDVVHVENPEKALALAEAADIIHLHNYLEYASDDFYPIDFASLLNEGKQYVRQFHSEPKFVADEMGIDQSQLIRSSIPSLTLLQ